MIMKFFSWFGSFLTGGALDRVFDVIDKKVQNEADRDKLKTDIIKTHYNTRADYMNAGGFVLMLLFAVPLAFWFGAVIFYSVFWCADCAFPQTWTVAALPAPLNEWGGMVVLSIFGVMGVSKLRK